MLNTVPTGTTLSTVVGPRPWILRESHLDLLSNGGVTYSGSIVTHGTATPLTTASYFYGTVGGGNTGPKTSGTNGIEKFLGFKSELQLILVTKTQTSVAFGSITDYPFNDTLNSPSVTSINVMNSYTVPINLSIFVLVSQSFSIPTSGAAQFVVRAAVSNRF